MLGKAMWFGTVCTLAFAISGRASRDKGVADSKGITEDLEHRLMQEANFEDHLSNTTNVSSTPLRKPSSKLYSAVRRLAVISAALRFAQTADGFTTPGVQPTGPFQRISSTAFAPRLPSGVGVSAPSTATRIFSSGSPSEGVEESDMFKKENADRKKFGMPLLTPDEFIQEKVDASAVMQRKEAAADKAAEMTKPKRNSIGMDEMTHSNLPDFTGKWSMDLSKSDPLRPLFREVGLNFLLISVIEWLPVTQVIVQSEEALEIKISTPVKDNNLTLRLDGAEIRNFGVSGDLTSSTSRWVNIGGRTYLQTRHQTDDSPDSAIFITQRSLQSNGSELWEESSLERDGVIVQGAQARRILRRV